MYVKTIISSPIGDLIAIASEKSLVFLDFSDSPDLEKKCRKITKNAEILKTKNSVLTETEKQLREYFLGKRKEFDLPIEYLSGTEFQEKSWNALRKIPYGKTVSYQEEATMIGSPKAVRAIGWANHANPIVIIIPCHRVIGKGGKLVGYGGGLTRKQWLLEHEKKSL